MAEHLRLGSWDLIKSYTGGDNLSLEPRIAMQLVNEASLCKNRIRKSNYISHQGFELLNGLGFLVTDEQVHELLVAHTISDAQSLQQVLSLIRMNRGHFQGNVIAIDPHRIISTTKRTMPMKKKHPHEPSRKMMQTFFALDTGTGQPLCFGIGSPGVNTTSATIGLLPIIEGINRKALLLADKEHFTHELVKYLKRKTEFEFLIPVITSKRIKNIERSLNFQPLWAGYAFAQSPFYFGGDKKDEYRLLVQREGEVAEQYSYKSFLALPGKSSYEMLSEKYPQRWSIEEFFNFDGAMGFDRASTFNLNIRYGKMSLALLAQAATYQLRQKLPKPYNRWNALHLADALFSTYDGAISVKDDTIIITCYNVPKALNLQQHYQNLPQKLTAEGIDPRIPWLYDFKLDFRFR